MKTAHRSVARKQAGQVQPRLPRREFVRKILRSVALSTFVCPSGLSHAAGPAPQLEAGEGVVDITPPLGTVLGGFHYPPERPRKTTGIRQPSNARALVLALRGTEAAIVSLDMLNVSFEVVGRVQRRVEKETGILASQVRVCASHSHTMPSTAYNRQWGEVSPEYVAQVEAAVAQAVRLAKEDLAPGQLYVGQSRAEEANFNRTVATWKTDQEFTSAATDEDRWLDSLVQVLHFERLGGRRNLLWYHFSAHPTCFSDGHAGPDWPGVVGRILQSEEQAQPSFLQGHIGDVSSASAEQTGRKVSAAIERAIATAKRTEVLELRVRTRAVQLPFDMDRFRASLDQYGKDPAACRGGEWVDAAFAKDWFEQFASKWDMKKTSLPITLAAMQIGGTALLFHPAELYSYYGLAIRHRSSFPQTMVVGYADGYVGYVADPKAYLRGEYAAVVVPKILNYPPFTPGAGGVLAQEAGLLLQELKG